MDLEFERDEDKSSLNTLKHGISSQTARLVFNDNDMVIFPDNMHSIYEERYIAIGRVGELLFVVYTEKANKIRLISARTATPQERENEEGGKRTECPEKGGHFGRYQEILQHCINIL